MLWILRINLYFGLFLASFGQKVAADDAISVAVASNFHHVARQIADGFERSSGFRVRMSPGSSGKLYAQAVHGAPYHVLMSADQVVPQRLEQDGVAVAGSRFTYALGRLALWSTQSSLRGQSCLEALRAGQFRKLAVANDQLAPYGQAAREVISTLGLTDQLRNKLVIGENIAQTFQFVATGNAALGFVAYSQLLQPQVPQASCIWKIPSDQHAPIVQQAVLMQRASESSGAKQFLQYLAGAEAAKLIRANGYDAITPVHSKKD